MNAFHNRQLGIFFLVVAFAHTSSNVVRSEQSFTGEMGFQSFSIERWRCRKTINCIFHRHNKVEALRKWVVHFYPPPTHVVHDMHRFYVLTWDSPSVYSFSKHDILSGKRLLAIATFLRRWHKDLTLCGHCWLIASAIVLKQRRLPHRQWIGLFFIRSRSNYINSEAVENNASLSLLFSIKAVAIITIDIIVHIIFFFSRFYLGEFIIRRFQ